MLDIPWSCPGFHLQVFCFPRCWEPCCWTSGKGRARKKNLRVFEYWKFQKNSLKTVTVDSFKEEIRCTKWFLLSIFVLHIPGLPLNWPGTPPDSSCRTPSMEIGFKDIYWKWNKMGGRHLLIESIAPTLTFYTISYSDIVGLLWLFLVWLTVLGTSF